MSNTTKWRDETRKLLNNRPASLPLATIAVELGVSVAWLRMFGRGEIDNPGVNTIEALKAFLTKKVK